MIFLHSKFILNKLKFYHTNLIFQEVSFSKSKPPSLSGSLVWTFKFMEWINKHSWSCPSLKLEVRLVFAQLEYTGPVVYEITLHSQSASVLHFLTAPCSPWDAAGMPWQSPVQVMHLLSQRGAAARQDFFLCTAGSGWLASHLAGLRNDRAKSTLWWSGRSDAALFESPYDGEGPAPQRHRERSWRLVEGRCGDLRSGTWVE